jgi:hypothetical protein
VVLSPEAAEALEHRRGVRFARLLVVREMRPWSASTRDGRVSNLSSAARSELRRLYQRLALLVAD